MSVFVADEQDRSVDAERLADLARHVLAERRVPADMEVSLILVDEETIAGLNERHLGKKGPTDVLAFPIDEPGETFDGVPAILGDVVLCPSVAAANATDGDDGLLAELELLTVHGILHLLGMDHAAPEEEREMFDLTDRLLASYRTRD